MKPSQGNLSPVARSPANTMSTPHGKITRSVSDSTLPPYELDPVTRQLIEENEDMLYKIGSLTHELRLAQSEVKRLNDVIAEKERDVDVMRTKLGDATIQACDASGKVINYKTECERLTEDNKHLREEYEKVCAALEQQTNDIRRGMEEVRTGSAREQASELVKQIHQEIVNLFPNVDRAVCSLKRCVVVSADHPDRVLESAQRELSSLQRLAHFLRRIDVGDESHVNSLISCVHKKEPLSSPGDLAIIIRWMIVQAFESGISATEGNLRAITSLLAADMNNKTHPNTAGDVGGRSKARSLTTVSKQKTTPHATK